MKSLSASTTVGVVVAAMSLLLAPSRMARGVDDSPTTATPRARALSDCGDLRAIAFSSASRTRRDELYAADLRLNAAIDSSADRLQKVEVPHADRLFRGAHLVLAVEAIGGIVLCVLFCRAPGVSRRERGLCLAVFLALLGQGLFEARSDHAARLAAARKTEQAEIEVGTLVADRSRLQARWQYDRLIAVADILFEQCQAAAAATPEAFSE
jgi:hypothetical protein